MKSITQLLLFIGVCTQTLPGQSPPASLQATIYSNITSTSTLDAGGVIDNRSQYYRRNSYHSYRAFGTGTWSVDMQWADGGLTNWTSYGSTAQVSNVTPASGIGFGLDPANLAKPYHDYIRFVITGSATIQNYFGTKQAWFLPTVSTVSFPITINQGGTGTQYGDPVNVKAFGATGDGATNDTTAIQAAVTYACTLTGGFGANSSAKVLFPTPAVAYVVSAQINLCARLELQGDRATVSYTGPDILFSIPASNQGSIHGFNLQGNVTANQWAIKCIGSNAGASGCILEHIYDNYFNKWGDVATHSGGAIWNNANSEKFEVNNNGIFINGTPFRCDNNCGDKVSFRNNDVLNTATPCVIIVGNSLATKQTVEDNNLVCNSAVQASGTTSITVDNNEFEAFQAITNASNAAYEFLGGGGTIFAHVHNNYANLHNLGKYGYYADNSSASSSFFYNTCVPFQPGGGQRQYCIRNGNGNLSNTFGFNNLFQPAPNASMYEFPADVGVINWPLQLYTSSLADSLNILRGTTTFTNLNSLSAATWASGVLTYTSAGTSIATGTLVQVSNASPGTFNTVCIATAISANQFSCPITYDPGTWTVGGVVAKASVYTLPLGVTIPATGIQQIASSNLSDSTAILRGAVTFNTLNVLATASWSSGVITYNSVGTNVATNGIANITGATPSGYNLTCLATAIDVDRFSCLAPTNPGTWVSGGVVGVALNYTVPVGATLTYNKNSPPANSVACYKAGGVIGYATTGGIGTTCN